MWDTFHKRAQKEPHERKREEQKLCKNYGWLFAWLFWVLLEKVPYMKKFAWLCAWLFCGK